MPQRVPVFDSGLSITRKASADITGGQLVQVTGNGTVGPTTAAATSWLGTAGFDAKSGEDVTVHKGGVQRCDASGAIAAGDMVAAAASGAVATSATPTVGQLVGIAVSAAVDGVVEIDMVR